mmetsp:Transcript_6353/g.9300  ORF Transcript_6353/g.9300 Transcript_6353/m.9300 type:complete len:423 (+) Transcript_6353:561-1829(+)
MSINPIATIEEDNEVYERVCKNLIHYVEGSGEGRSDPALAPVMADYVAISRNKVKVEHAKRAAFALERWIQSQKEVKSQKALSSEYEISKLNAERELQDKRQELDKIGEKHEAAWDDLSKKHEKNDAELRKKLETYEIQMRREREALQYLTDNDPSLPKVEEEISNAKVEVVRKQTHVSAGEQQLELKEAEEKKARDNFSATVVDLKLRQPMGAGSIDVREESLPGARLPMSKILQWLGGSEIIQRTQRMTRQQLEELFFFLHKTGFDLNVEFYGRQSSRQYLSGKSRLVNGSNETADDMRLRMARALTPVSHEFPEWGLEVKSRLNAKEENAREQKVSEQREAATVQEASRKELYSPAAFKKTMKRVLLDSDDSYEPPPSPNAKRARRECASRPPLMNRNDPVHSSPPRGLFDNNAISKEE